MSAKVPHHIGFIVDGNGRWAKARSLPRSVGHLNGAKAVQRVLEACRKFGIKMATFWVFSTENWTRPKEEIDYLMKLFLDYLTKRGDKLIENRARFRVLGDKSRFSPAIQDAMRDLEEKTKGFSDFFVNFMMNYGGQDEILRVTRRIAAEAAEGRLSPGDVTRELFDRYSDLCGDPYPDFVIRTSGEQRLSGFLSWCAGYSELYFPKYHFPDFDEEKLKEALDEYSRRDRRFGQVRED
ncbi:MAG: di-trans,poly-cis-decaprenylcistransferase [Rickettsiales bacterium]|jgi:undecaprenyl diphosphate synthase|nr:di-trans,poly-cis-decaprenylcistransferase [Rickettsiales bacterium]